MIEDEVARIVVDQLGQVVLVGRFIEILDLRVRQRPVEYHHVIQLTVEFVIGTKVSDPQVLGIGTGVII